MKNINEIDILSVIKTSQVCINEISRILDISVEDLNIYLLDYNMSKKNDNFLCKDGINNDIKIFIDGGSRGNPGESGLGVVILFDNTKKGYYFYNNIATNNEAEYNALIKSLVLAKKYGFNKIKVFSDSELICNQINGIYKVKNERLKKYNTEAKKLICEFKDFSLNYVPREFNKDADKMANIAMDLKKNGEVELTVAESIND